jgi:magnesium-transporting ATPase (P-type)
MEIEESSSYLNSKRTSLRQEEATKRLAEFGPNELKKDKGYLR